MKEDVDDLNNAQFDKLAILKGEFVKNISNICKHHTERGYALSWIVVDEKLSYVSVAIRCTYEVCVEFSELLKLIGHDSNASINIQFEYKSKKLFIKWNYKGII